MKYKVERASDILITSDKLKEEWVDINTIEDLLEVQKKYGDFPLIFWDKLITIYDYYIE